MTRTFDYAKVGYIVGYHPDGTFISPLDVEVIDPDTGKAPVDEHGKVMFFDEVHAAEGWAVWWVPDEQEGQVLQRIERRLIIRLAA